jgi:hypothetical protein
VLATITLPNGQKVDVEIDSAATANETIGILAKKVGLEDASFFSLFECFSYLKDPTVKLGSLRRLSLCHTKNHSLIAYVVWCVCVCVCVRVDRSLYMEEFVMDAYAKAEHAARSYSFHLAFKRKISPLSLRFAVPISISVSVFLVGGA